MKTPLAARCIVLAVLAAAASGEAASAPLDYNRFVVGWPIDLPSDGAFFDVRLSDEIYRYSRSLNQLAVLDANGEPMPFYRVTIPAPLISENRITLGLSPVYAQDDTRAASDITVRTEGERTDVTVARSGDEASEPEIVSFIVDARAVENAPQAIALNWRPLGQPFLMTVSIEHSERLTGWRNVGRGTVAALMIDNALVTHGQVDVRGRPGGYYRITWDRRIRDWRLENVELIVSESAESTTFASVDVSPVQLSEEPTDESALFFDVGGELPVTSADLVFPSTNRWANASIQWANVPGGPWRQAASRRLFYDIDYEGERVASPAIEFDRVEARYWRVNFYPGILPGGAELRLVYPEEHLRFAANGQPPYMLVGGTLSSEAGPDPTLAAVMAALVQETRSVPVASLAERMVLGGESALAIPREFPWKTVLLWFVLLAAGVTIGWMAVRLARDMSAGN